jgi:hypothetical protein
MCKWLNKKNSVCTSQMINIFSGKYENYNDNIKSLKTINTMYKAACKKAKETFLCVKVVFVLQMLKCYLSISDSKY